MNHLLPRETWPRSAARPTLSRDAKSPSVMCDLPATRDLQRTRRKSPLRQSQPVVVLQQYCCCGTKLTGVA